MWCYQMLQFPGAGMFVRVWLWVSELLPSAIQGKKQHYEEELKQLLFVLKY